MDIQNLQALMTTPLGRVVENINQVFWICSADLSETLYASPAYETIWGRSPQMLYEKPESFTDPIHSDDIERVNTAIMLLLQGQTMDEEYRIVRPDNQERWIHDRAFPIADSTGKTQYLAGIAEDITYRKQAEEEIFKSLQRQQELSEAKSRFIANTSHEIRTPLTTIQSSLDMLQNYSDKLTDDKKQGHFQKIENAIKRTTDIFQDIFLLSESEADSLQVQRSSVNVVQLCQEVIDRVTDNNNKSRIEFDSLKENIQVLVDPNLSQNILTNLLQNALKYSTQNTKIEFNLNANQETVIFIIKDQGIGISSENIPHIFDAFYRANNVGDIGGTGLGLTIVKQCVDLQKGEIAVKSVVGEGTTFTITLPNN